MQNKKSKNLYYGIVALIVVALIIFWSMKKEVVPVGNLDQNADLSINQDATTSESKSVAKTNTSGLAGSISYEDALMKYANQRIQFDTACQAHPNTFNYKKNSSIMLDNRSPEDRTIKIGTNYTVKAYGFRIVTLSNLYLESKVVLVNCDSSKNVATIIVQD
jgi:hypothetical protein